MLNSCFCIVLLSHLVFLSQVIENVEKLRSVLTQPSNLRVHVAADVKRLPANPHTLWKTHLLPNSLATIPTKYGLTYVSWLYCTSIKWWTFFVSSVDLKKSTFSMESLVGIWAASLNEKVQAILYVTIIFCVLQWFEGDSIFWVFIYSAGLVTARPELLCLPLWWVIGNDTRPTGQAAWFLT